MNKLADARHKVDFPIQGTGEETRSFCYISDVIDCMILSIEKMKDSHLIGPLNIGSEERIRIIDLARKIIEISGKDIDLEIIFTVLSNL